MNILIVEDQEDLSALISEHLEEKGIKSDRVGTGEEALDLMDPDIYDLVILDRGLPDMEGLEFLKILREGSVKTPVLVLTAKDELGDKVEGLNSGADDYLVKPFEMEELIARVHALYRRPADAVHIVSKIGNVEFSAENSVLSIAGNLTDITAKEKDALERLLRLPGRVVSKDTLLSTFYGHGEEGSHNSVEVVMHRLRKKLEEAGADVEIKTLRGIGYMIKESDDV